MLISDSFPARRSAGGRWPGSLDCVVRNSLFAASLFLSSGTDALHDWRRQRAWHLETKSSKTHQRSELISLSAPPT